MCCEACHREIQLVYPTCTNVISTKSNAKEGPRLEVNTIKISGCKSIAV